MGSILSMTLRSQAIPPALRSSGQLFVARGMSQVGTLAASVLVARSTGPKGLGLYSAGFALGSVVVGGPTTGLPFLVLRSTSERTIDLPTLRTAVKTQLAVSVVAVAVAGVIGDLSFGGVQGLAIGLTAGLAFVGLGLALLGSNVQSGSKRFLRAAIGDAAAGILFPVFTVLALALRLGVPGVLGAIAAAAFCAAIIQWYRLPPLLPASRLTRLRFTDALPFVLIGAMAAGYGRIDTYTLDLVAGTQVVGYYSAAYRLLGVFSLGGSAFGTVYYARLSEHGSTAESWERTRRTGALYFLLFCLSLLVALELGVPLIINVVYGSSFRPAIVPARILLLSIVPWALYWPKANALNSAHRERRLGCALALGLVVDCLAVAIIGRRFGASGAAWAWVVAESLTLLAVSLFGRGVLRHQQQLGEH
jgi:O-antigen/teichoic acid export membrane protein